MTMSILLRFRDRPRHELRRLTLALAGLCRSIAARDTGAKERFAGLSRSIARALPLMKRTGRGRPDLLSHLETAAACLERAYLDMELHELTPDEVSIEALLFAGRALQLQADFIARPAAQAPLAEAAKNIASASKGLAPALRAAAAENRDFIANLKFSRIYSGLEKTVRAVDDYAELLARTL